MALFSKKKATPVPTANGLGETSPPVQLKPAVSTAPITPPPPKVKPNIYTWALLLALVCLLISLVYLIIVTERLRSQGHAPLARNLFVPAASAVDFDSQRHTS